MAITLFLVEPKSLVNSLLKRSFHQLPPLRSPLIKFPYYDNNAFKLSYYSCCYSNVMRYNSPKLLRSKCFFMSPNMPKCENVIDGNGGGEEDNDMKAISCSGTNEQVVSRSSNALQKPVSMITTTTCVLLGLLILLYDRHHALAASGGRMGGRSFSSSSSSSSRTPKSSLSSSSRSPKSSSSYTSSGSPQSSSGRQKSSATSSSSSESRKSSFSSSSGGPKSSSSRSPESWSFSSESMWSSSSFGSPNSSSSYSSESPWSSSSPGSSKPSSSLSESPWSFSSSRSPWSSSSTGSPKKSSTSSSESLKKSSSSSSGGPKKSSSSSSGGPKSSSSSRGPQSSSSSSGGPQSSSSTSGGPKSSSSGGPQSSSSSTSEGPKSSSSSSSGGPQPSFSSSGSPQSSSSSSSYGSPESLSERSKSYTTQTRVPEPAVAVEPDMSVVYGCCALMIMYAAFCMMDEIKQFTTPVQKTSVLKLQVGLLGTGRSLQTDLNRIADAADTSTPEGLTYILQETILALLRHPDYCISAYSSVDAKKSIVEVEELLNQFSIEERGKFDEETLVNVDNIKKQSATIRRSNDFRNEYIVVTIIVAAEGVHKLPPINNSVKLKEALQKLASIPSSKVKAVEVLWTPQDENDTLTEREYFQDYSLLRPL